MESKIKKRKTSNSKLNILLIEDNPGDARLIQEMLSEVMDVQFDLSWADSLSIGLEYLAKGSRESKKTKSDRYPDQSKTPFNLVLLDLGLPDSQGIESLLPLLKQVPEVPIVVLTGLIDEEIGVKAVQKGAQDYLVKGQVDSNSLARAIRYSMERKQTEKQLRQYREHLEKLVYERTAELKRSNEKLQQEIIEHKQTEKQLRQHRENLEKMVEDRTRKLQEAQKELINSAMEAGRVQLSAMVLHNIGNAITPIKVQVEEMKSKQLEQICDYLEKCYLDLNEHARDLPQYVNVNPRGKEVFSFMGNLIEALKAFGIQNKNLADKIDQTVAYISEILTLQQAYAARDLETKERIDLNMLIEDAICMQKNALEKRGIILKKDLDHNQPKLLVDKNRLMQVIVNIIMNSYEAIDELNDNKKENVINIKTFSENGKVGVKITDSGIGIEHDKIDTIFEFGESHKGSSGFGLYYCRMFVEANQGVLTLRSPGKGKGATVEMLFNDK